MCEVGEPCVEGWSDLGCLSSFVIKQPDRGIMQTWFCFGKAFEAKDVSGAVVCESNTAFDTDVCAAFDDIGWREELLNSDQRRLPKDDDVEDVGCVNRAESLEKSAVSLW